MFSFANHYLPRGTALTHPYVSPGMQPMDLLKNVPRGVIFTCTLDPLRYIGVEYVTKLKQAGNTIACHHFDTLSLIVFYNWLHGVLKP